MGGARPEGDSGLRRSDTAGAKVASTLAEGGSGMAICWTK